MTRVSVVVPVCNVARYLPECLDSLLAQTLRELEIVAVDDGSTDESPAILAHYAARTGASAC
jgi:glycosyltransferase involved in cell wall biosynthesis